jgi:hypothetical protein
MTHERSVWAELKVQVEFDYQPAEAAERGPEAQYPGCPECFEIIGIYVGEAEITGQLSEKERAAILEALVDKMDLERRFL